MWVQIVDHSLTCEKHVKWELIFLTSEGEKNSLKIALVLSMTSQGTLDCLVWISNEISSKTSLIL